MTKTVTVLIRDYAGKKGNDQVFTVKDKKIVDLYLSKRDKELADLGVSILEISEEK